MSGIGVTIDIWPANKQLTNKIFKMYACLYFYFLQSFAPTREILMLKIESLQYLSQNLKAVFLDNAKAHRITLPKKGPRGISMQKLPTQVHIYTIDRHPCGLNFLQRITLKFHFWRSYGGGN